mgnify:FL=1
MVKNTKEACNTFLKRAGQHRYVRMGLCAVGLFVFPFLLLGVIRLADALISAEVFTRLDDGVNVWFAFWGSYLPTVLLSVAAMYAASKYDKISREKNNVQIAMSFPDLKVSRLIVYDLDKWYPADTMELSDDFKSLKYLLKIEFSAAFSPYFDMGLEQFAWCRILSEKLVEGKLRPEEMKRWIFPVNGAVIENDAKLILYIPIPRGSCREAVEDLHRYYFINYYETAVMRRTEKIRKIEVGLKCETKMLDSETQMAHRDYGIFGLRLSLWVENKDTYGKPYIELTVRNRLLEMRKNSKVLK